MGALLLFAVTPVFTGVPFISYASSESMEPTIGAFDLFAVNPWPVGISTGDIIVFTSTMSGGPTVHRVVGGDENGWYTQGDGNAVIDQLKGEPIVTADRVLGRVVTTPSGDPVIVRDLGVAAAQLRVERVKLAQAVGGEKELLGVVFAGAAALALAGAAFGGRARPTPRSPSSPAVSRFLRRTFPRGILGRHVALAALLLFVAASGWSAAHAGTELTTTMVVVDDPSTADGTRATTQGGVISKQIDIGSLGLLPTLALVESGSQGVVVPEPHARVAPGGQTRVAYDHVANGPQGLQVDKVVVWRYPIFLPTEATVALHETMPGSPYFAIAGIFGLTGFVWVRAQRLSTLPVGRWLGIQEDWR